MQLLRESHKKEMLSTPTTELTMRKNQATQQHHKIKEFNDIFSCFLCKGYMINPATVENCLHSYCRSCIVRHLLYTEAFCPQCNTKGGKQISLNNLKSDDVLRSVIYKLVPGLYQKERERILQFTTNLRNGQHKLDEQQQQHESKALENDDEFFGPTEPISLSLEYHPVLLKGCLESQIPSIRYLQCPASVKILHLKRFLCSKFNIDPDNKNVRIEVIYEDEVLPDNFSLMDVGYTYDWRRNAPMKFKYRILLYNNNNNNSEAANSNLQSSVGKQKTFGNNHHTNIRGKNVSFLDNNKFREPIKAQKEAAVVSTLTTGPGMTPLAMTSSSKVKISKTSRCKETLQQKLIESSQTEQMEGEEEEDVAPVKFIIARKSTESAKKSSPKRMNHDDATYTITNDFKSLRSNDIRYSNYGVTAPKPTTTTPALNTQISADKNSPKSESSSELPKNLAATTAADAAAAAAATVSKCDIVVSIPHSQMPKSPYSVDDLFENVSLAQLKTASKKSPTSTHFTSNYEIVSKKSKNVPKLKIELNSLKTKLTIPKPKSADPRLEEIQIRKSNKHRKHSLDDTTGPTADKVDLETYAKNIGLKPIDVMPPTDPNASESSGKFKYSPNASPMSSSSSSASVISSSNSVGGESTTLLLSSIEATNAGTTVSFHKKRKKKHSKDSKDSKEGKRRKLHAEISSQPVDESLKMKVKITAAQPHTHKQYKPTTLDKKVVNDEINSSTTDLKESKTESNNNNNNTNSNMNEKDKANMIELNKTLGEESLSINNLMRNKSEHGGTIKSSTLVKTTVNDKKSKVVVNNNMPPTLGAAKPNNWQPKPLSNVKEVKLPSSPPLPPSLFKTTTLPFTTLVAATTTLTHTKSVAASALPTQLSKTTSSAAPISSGVVLPATKLQTMDKKNIKPKPMLQQSFAVPNPPRPITKFCSTTPTSIASAMNKLAQGMQLKRSASLDEAYSASTKQQKLEQDRIKRKTAYGAFFGNNSNQISSTSMYQNQLIASTPLSTSSSSSVSATLFAHKEKDEKAEGGSVIGKSFDMPYYAPISAAYKPEYAKRKITTDLLKLPAPSVRLCKTNDSNLTQYAAGGTTNAITILSRQKPNITTTQLQLQPQLNLLPFSRQNLQLSKPSAQNTLAIASNNLGPTDVLTVPPPLSPKSGTNKLLTARKNSSSLQLSPTVAFKNPTSTSSTTVTSSSSSCCVSPPALINFRKTCSQTIPSSNSTTSTITTTTSPATTSATLPTAVSSTKPKSSLTRAEERAISATEKTKSILREFRPTCKEDSVDILDLSSGKMQDTAKTSSVGNSLEAALNKIKQNISSSSGIGTVEKSHTTILKKLNTSSNNDDLQNLHLLSESATAREKIAIKASSPPSLEKTKPSLLMVRQQNPSVRNIPNPSALAFRNPPITLPAAATLSLTSSPPSPQRSPPPPTSQQPTTKVNSSTLSSTAQSTLLANSTREKSVTGDTTNTKPQTTTAVISSVPLAATSTTISTSKGTAITTTTTTQSPPRVATKKATTIDQVAANLNIRAAAAEASAAKALNISTTPTYSSSSEEPVLVSSTSSSTTEENKSSDKDSKPTNAVCVLPLTPPLTADAVKGDAATGKSLKSATISSPSSALQSSLAAASSSTTIGSANFTA